MDCIESFPFYLLPLEIREIICENLSIVDIFRLEQVCKACKTNGVSQKFWKYIALKKCVPFREKIKLENPYSFNFREWISLVGSKMHSITSLMPVPCIFYDHRRIQKIMTWIIRIDWDKEELYSKNGKIHEDCFILGLETEHDGTVSSKIPFSNSERIEIFCDNFILFGCSANYLWNLEFKMRKDHVRRIKKWIGIKDRLIENDIAK